MTKYESMLNMIKLKYPNIYHEIEDEWRVEETNKVLSRWAAENPSKRLIPVDDNSNPWKKLMH
jgi:hypothetical protein